MKSFTLQNSVEGRIEHIDKKRYLWLSAMVLPLMPLVAIGFALHSGNNWYLISPVLFGYLFVPLIDYMVGTDRTNPPEEAVPELDADPYYRVLTMIAVPMHFVTLIISVWFIATTILPLGLYLALAMAIGLYSGLSINTAHELGHRNTKLEQFLARVSLSLTGYGHFCVEHNAGHHRDVSTPEDPASARMGESIYRFMLREIPGAAKRGWQIEAQRLHKRSKSVWSLDNRILQSYGMTLLFQGGLLLVFGWVVLLFLLVHNAVAWFQLTSTNYIEHYGLLRMKKSNGRYESCQPHHSWNANHIFSNLMLFQLERHSDHHTNPSRRYQSLRSLNGTPELPSGYFGMYLLAYFPWLWFKVMNPRLLAVPHINGDMSKVNLDPKQADRLIAMYAN